MNNDNFKNFGLFLKNKRAAINPADYGIPINKNRRVGGLRREEVAELAHISTDWYTKLEQGRKIRPSIETLDILSDILHLNSGERKYIFSLLGIEVPPSHDTETKITTRLQNFLDSQNPNPAYITDWEYNFIGWNTSALAVFGDYRTMNTYERNSVWRLFTDSSMSNLLDDWEGHAKLRVSQLRIAYIQNPSDMFLTSLVERLCKLSDVFTEIWHDIDIMGTPEGDKLLHHPKVGELRLSHLTFLTDEVENVNVTVNVANDNTTQNKLAFLYNNFEKNIKHSV
ncbi:helix-turn-helix transcriptional regulator [Leuconostoc pseudomesenteroides]|uniref:Helix-turn-helix transcriptional regulator n=1 Tax=Leuconostoc pseudomesenteroides TaxID=33968 RepID=A0ABT6HEH0_LEUPS|nr:helix-turn-helix transcriptional regulator [Leuconostoc pseudomesenteroides]MDG9734451.1 helix-turn-helix transcriptional regulator [Leuconostoc pseudomesenteroides]NKZ36691.1 helix-turn-helix domain-containing protein [Leuconostoc pseudomesenteroides]QQB26483.1 helix-turn-helix domain-containing protein [Leuconostoc pseudomesenteroides]